MKITLQVQRYPERKGKMRWAIQVIPIFEDSIYPRKLFAIGHSLAEAVKNLEPLLNDLFNGKVIK